MPSLKDLPNELLIFIVSYLPVHTKKVFRLTCRAYEPIPLPFLFRWIRLSRLREDKDAFEGIAAHPHLQVNARELVWYELELEAWYPDDMLFKDIDYALMDRLVSDASSDRELFWIPRYSFESSPRHFERRFLELLVRIPGLETIISRRMPASRSISYKGYSLLAAEWSHNLDPIIPGGNQGFFTLLSEISDLSGVQERDLLVVTEEWVNPEADKTIYGYDCYDDVDYDYHDSTESEDDIDEGDTEEGDTEGGDEEDEVDEGDDDEEGL
ncbi:hypothetical protein DL769_010565 [Monosporascus sp. CRB-8-3]|nr:hypothetical protein DL769_010565 [Monosporascus sp. CRB-8-3]